MAGAPPFASSKDSRLHCMTLEARLGLGNTIRAKRPRDSETMCIYGRASLTSDLLQELQGPNGARLLVEGPRGIGKTAFLRHLSDELKAQQPHLPALYHEIASGANSVEVVLGRLAADLIQQLSLPSTGLDRLRESLNAVAWNNASRLSLALLLDAAKGLAPELTATVEALSEVGRDALAGGSISAIAEGIAKRGTGDSLMGFLNLMRSLSDAGLAGTLLIDRVEAASPEVREVVRKIAAEAPGAWNAVLSVNNETDAGAHAIDDLWPDLAYQEFERRSMPRLNEADLAEWLRHKDQPVPEVAELSTIVRYCDGRPLFLRDWVAGLEAETVGESLITRLGPFYHRRFRALSDEAKEVLTALAILPTRAHVQFSFIQKLLPEKSAVQVNAVIDELKSVNFVEEGGAPYRIVHETTALVLAKELPQEVVKECAAKALDAVSEETLQGERSDLAFVRTRLASLAGNDELVAALGVEAGKHLISAGSLSAATESFDAAVGAAERIGRVDSIAKARLGLSEILLHTGSYARALEELDDLPDSAQVLLLRARALVRLNRYPEAEEVLSNFRIKEDADPDLSNLLAEKERNTILRDLGRYQEAEAQAEELVALARGLPNLPRETLATCLRASARSLALAGNTDRSLSLAQEAFRLGEDLGSSRDIGSALLARAEALRHGGRYSDAADAYNDSLRIGIETLNRDLELWSALGLVNSRALDGDVEMARRVLDVHTRPLVAGAADRHPLEHLHWRFSQLILRVLRDEDLIDAEAEEIISAYETLGIAWPRSYMADLIATRRLEPTPF